MTDDNGEICQIPNLYVKQKSGEPDNFPLEPSAILVNDKSRWILWFFDKPTIEVDLTEKIQGELARVFHGDLSVAKIGQMLPIPGINGVEIQKFDPDLTYDIPDFENLLTIPVAEKSSPTDEDAKEDLRQSDFMEAPDALEDGFILIYRDLINKPYFVDSKTVHLMLYLLLKANYKPKDVFIRGQIVKVKRGQLIFGRKAASEKTGLTEQEIRTRLQFLRNAEFLTSKTTNRFSLITICNYDHYQDPYGRNNQQNNQQVTSKQPRLKKDKEIYMLKFFERFWKEYPKKKDKKKAREKFLGLSLDEEKFKRIMKALRKQKESDQWKRDKGQYIPNPPTWLHGERWNDEIDTTSPKKDWGKMTEEQLKDIKL